MSAEPDAVPVEAEHGRDRWNGRYSERERSQPASAAACPEPPRALRRLASMIPPGGRVVDLAGGDGGGALFLAGRGLDACLVDVADIALERAAVFARRRELPLRTLRADVTDRPLGWVLDRLGPPAPALVTCWNYLDRTLLRSVAEDLPGGARFAVTIATTTNRQRHERPPARFLLDPGELATLVVPDDRPRLRVLHRREGWAEDRHVAELVVEAR